MFVTGRESITYPGHSQLNFQVPKRSSDNAGPIQANIATGPQHGIGMDGFNYRKNVQLISLLFG